MVLSIDRCPLSSGFLAGFWLLITCNYRYAWLFSAKSGHWLWQTKLVSKRLKSLVQLSRHSALKSEIKGRAVSSHR